MVNDRADVESTLRNVLGRELGSVTDARHRPHGSRSGDMGGLVHFWMHFTGVPPLMWRGRGDDLLLEVGEPYASYVMGEYGDVHVGPVEPSDVLARLPGRRLLDAALMQGYAAAPAVSGVRLRFDDGDWVVAAVGDEWVIGQTTPAGFDPDPVAEVWLASGGGAGG